MLFLFEEEVGTGYTGGCGGAAGADADGFDDVETCLSELEIAFAWGLLLFSVARSAEVVTDGDAEPVGGACLAFIEG